MDLSHSPSIVQYYYPMYIHTVSMDIGVGVFP